MKKRAGAEARSVDKKTIVYASLIIVVIIVPTVFILQLLTNYPIKPKAAIIDQLSSSHLSPTSQFENQTFIDLATSLLRERFDVIDYYSDNATVENYRQLPSRGYKLIIWRTHSALDLDSQYVAISTSERELQTGYEQYIQNDQLTLCQILNDPYKYYAVTPKFIREVMNGRLEDTVIFLMSCNGLKPEYVETAAAFEDKGAKALIGWDGWISSADNDDATTNLLSYLINENNTVNDAVSKIPEYSSPDFGSSKLNYFPLIPAAGNYQIPDYRETAQATTQSAMTLAFT